jgi:NAD+ synthase (glutamine-hydrolysing)
MDELIKQKPDFAINIAASPFSYTHDLARTNMLARNAAQYGIPFFYVNHTGAQTELIFDGQSLAVNAKGDIYKMPAFEECLSFFDLDKIKQGAESTRYQPLPKMEIIYKALVEGISGYFNKLGFRKALLGMSGGIDSALVLALAVKALGKENVLAVLMPSPYSSEGSVNDALQMVSTLGCDHKIIPIAPIMDAYDEALAPHFVGLKPDITEENIQARARGAVLMALSNKLNHILLNTSNKSEIAVGYSTMYGDSIGALAVVGDLYKTEVYSEGPCIPSEIIHKAPSAELRPDQKDSDSLPTYDTLDAVLFQYIEKHQGPREIIAMGFDKDLVYRVLKLVNQSEYKRYQAPPVLRISDKSFGSGRRLPIVAKYLS